MKKNETGFSVAKLLITVVILGILGGLGWYFTHQNAKPANLDETLTWITRDAKNKYSNATFEPKYDWTAEASATAFNKVDGYDFTVSGVGQGIQLAYAYSDQPITQKRLKFFTHTIRPATSLDEVKEFVGKRLVKYGFKTTDNKSYTRDSNTCNVLNDPTSLFPNQNGSEQENSNLLQVTCFGPDALQQAASQMEPFVTEYLAAHPSLKASDLAVGPLTVKSKYGAGVIGSSKNAGYDIAELVISTKDRKQIALYYAKDADINTGQTSGWKYVTEANDEFGFKCEDMKKSPDAEKAFYDQVCLGADGQVRLDTNNRALQ
jgi:hypothetical protein